MKQLLLSMLVVSAIMMISACQTKPRVYKHAKTRNDLKTQEGEKRALVVKGFTQSSQYMNWTKNKQGKVVFKEGPKKGKLTRIGFSSSETRLRKGISIAANTEKLPIGTRILVPGWGQGVVEHQPLEIGENEIWVYFDKDSDAEKWGKQNLEVTVYLLKDRTDK